MKDNEAYLVAIERVAHSARPQISFRHGRECRSSAVELDHDFLWQIHKAVPPQGEIGIFNRFEESLSQNREKTLKSFLHISKDERKKRLEERPADPVKSWKMSLQDPKERELWKDYREAYEDALMECSTERAPWFIIPADKKWFRNLAVSQIIIEALESLEMKYPKPSFNPGNIVVQ